jgi:hypothetical protein
MPPGLIGSRFKLLSTTRQFPLRHSNALGLSFSQAIDYYRILVSFVKIIYRVLLSKTDKIRKAKFALGQAKKAQRGSRCRL